MGNPLVHPLVTLSLCCFCVVSVMAANNLTVGYLANIHGIHGKNRQGHIISGAMTYAVQQVNDRHVLPENYTLEFTYEDTEGETLMGTNAVINMWRKGVVAFFGPENSCEVEATVSASLNLPMISYYAGQECVMKQLFPRSRSLLPRLCRSVDPKNSPHD